jgi:hypothetical protein
MASKRPRGTFDASGSGLLHTPYGWCDNWGVTPRLTALRDRIRLLGAIDPALQIFGAVRHKHALAAPLPADELAALEARFGPLPEDYRQLVTELAASGAGPYYGLESPSVPKDPRGEIQPDPSRVFDGKHLDGTVRIADQGCGGRSLLVIRGPHTGEVWSDWTAEQGTVAPEARSLFAWYEAWIERALLDWIERVAPRIAVDDAESNDELEAVALAFELVNSRVTANPKLRRTLGYLHLREGRWDDADAMFRGAARVDGADEPTARLALDRARVAHKRGRHHDAIASVRLGLACSDVWAATRDELRDTLERAFHAVGLIDDAIAVLDQRAIESGFSLALHHRLARERLARNDLGGAGAALERASRMENVLGKPSTIDDRVPAAFDPIIEELERANRTLDAEALVARATLILEAN